MADNEGPASGRTAGAAKALLEDAVRNRKAGRLKEATAGYRGAMTLVPDSLEARIGLADSLCELGPSEEAVAVLEAGIALHPNSADLRYSLGRAYQRVRRLNEAVQTYRRVLEIDPRHADALNSLGLFFSVRGELETAVKLFQRALATRPDFPDALVNLGLNQKILKRYEVALLAFQAAARYDPAYARAHWSEAQLLLLLGRFEAGWSKYEWRWRTREPDADRNRLFPQPLWDGRRPLDGKLLVWSEQGIGDEVMFASLLPELAGTVECLLECDPRLAPLFRRSLPGVEMVPRAEPVPARLLAPDVVAQVAAGSLPRWLRPDRASFARSGGAYLQPDAVRRDRCRARYGTDRPVVGLAWHTTKNEPTAQRRIPVEEMLPMLRVPDVRFVSLQYGDHRAALAELTQTAQVEILQDPDIDQMADLDAFAAQVAALDLVITIDNSAAHMAGALGVPCWVLLPQPPEWRWLLEGGTCLWWSSLRLFRQSEWGRWGPVVEEVSQALAQWAASRSGSTAHPGLMN